MKNRRNEDLAFLDKVLLPFGIAAGLFGMGLGLMVCLEVL
jgi:hypothetical protein